jgi:uncharacterized coiled-coil protein SlyX
MTAPATVPTALRTVHTSAAYHFYVEPLLGCAPMEGRLVDLEIRYTHLERQYAELSQAVFDHQKQIEALQRELVAVQRRLQDLGDPVINEKPPHY